MLNRAQLAAARRRVTPGAQAVTLRSRRPGDDPAEYADHAVGFAKRYPDDGAESGTPGLHYQPRCRWQLWQADLSAAAVPAPKVGDIVVGADGVAWSVHGVRRKLLEQVFDLDCVRGPVSP